MKNLSSFFAVNFRDLVKGLIIAIIGAVIGLITVSIEAGSLNFDWAAMGKAALLAALGYLTKNFLTNSSDEFATKERK